MPDTMMDGAIERVKEAQREVFALLTRLESVIPPADAAALYRAVIHYERMTFEVLDLLGAVIEALKVDRVH
jgi:hypothetical protein